jgi:hypothetical protein
MALPPSISVVIVSDYAAGSEGEWTDLRKCLAALARQDLREPAEFILCESEASRHTLPTDLTAILPALTIIFVHADLSYQLKNSGVVAASCEYVAMLDADCVPRPDWLRLLLESLRRHPRAAAISGKTIYPGRSLFVRTAALLSRAYIDPGGNRAARFVGENNAAYRRSAYLSHPLPGAFAAHVQAEELRRAGYVLWCESRAIVQHDFEGWSMEKDVRRNRGHSTIKTRLLDASLPYAWLVRRGPLGIAPIIAWKILNSWRDCLRRGRSYGIRWYELPIVMPAAAGICLLEIPGMLAAFRGLGPGQTCFR